MSSLAVQCFLYHGEVYFFALACVPSHRNKCAGLFEMEGKWRWDENVHDSRRCRNNVDAATKHFFLLNSTFSSLRVCTLWLAVTNYLTLLSLNDWIKEGEVSKGPSFSATGPIYLDDIALSSPMSSRPPLTVTGGVFSPELLGLPEPPFYWSGAPLRTAAAHCSISAKLMSVAKKSASVHMFSVGPVNNPAALITPFQIYFILG